MVNKIFIQFYNNCFHTGNQSSGILGKCETMAGLLKERE